MTAVELKILTGLKEQDLRHQERHIKLTNEKGYSQNWLDLD
jgi:hypothetical protein